MLIECMEFLFWFLVDGILYTWIGYYLLLVGGTLYSRKVDDSTGASPSVTFLITAFNEEATITNRLMNLLEQKYGNGYLEVVVASDGSTDNTDDIVEAHSKRDHRVRLIRAEGQGKSATQNFAIPLANGEIVVLTDADTLFVPDALEKIARHFSDPKVGCVSGRLVLKKADGSVAESQGLYWRFEMALRRMESRLGVMHTATGGIMAFRKDLFRPFNPKYGDDCIIPLDIVEQGYRVVHDDEAIAYDTFPSSMRGELRARTRMTLRNITCTLTKYRLLNPFKYPLISLAIISHKLFRWLTPFFMLAVLFTNIFLINESLFFFLSAMVQGLFYLFGAAGFIGEIFKVRILVASQIFSFLLANTGFFLGVLKAICGKHVTSYKNYTACQGS